MINREFASWVESESADNLAATATRAAPPGGLAHFITSVSGGYSASANGKTMILREGATEKARWYVYDSFALSFSSPIQIAAGAAVSLELEASGGAGNLSAATLTGYTA